MGTAEDHRRHAEQCVEMAQRCEGETDKALWLTLAQSWARLAEYVALAPSLVYDQVEDVTGVAAAVAVETGEGN
jgi:hypothetical protein